MQHTQILLIRPTGLSQDERVVGQAKCGRRKQLLTVAVVGKGSRLANERDDQVPIVNPRPKAPVEPWQRERADRVSGTVVYVLKSPNEKGLFRHFGDQL